MNRHIWLLVSSCLLFLACSENEVASTNTDNVIQASITLDEVFSQSAIVDGQPTPMAKLYSPDYLPHDNVGWKLDLPIDSGKIDIPDTTQYPFYLSVEAEYEDASYKYLEFIEEEIDGDLTELVLDTLVDISVHLKVISPAIDGIHYRLNVSGSEFALDLGTVVDSPTVVLEDILPHSQLEFKGDLIQLYFSEVLHQGTDTTAIKSTIIAPFDFK